MCCEYLLHFLQCILLKYGSIHIFIDGMRIDEMMLYQFQFFWRRFGNTDIQFFKTLAAICRNDLGIKMLCKSYSKGCLPTAVGPTITMQVFFTKIF